MIVVGAKGFAKELLEVLITKKYNYNEVNLFFFDDINPCVKPKLFERFEILRSFREVQDKFKNGSNKFCLGIGSPKLRLKFTNRFIQLGGEVETIISSDSLIGKFGTSIGTGTTIIGNAVITNDVKIGKGCLIYMNTSITHDVTIGDFVEISPGVSIAGRCNIGNYTSLGVGATIMPDINLGSNCIIGAGTVIIDNVPNNSVVVGVPGRIIKTRNPF